MTYYAGAPKSSSPECAKIWEYLYKKDSDYADNISDICAKDMLSDSIGLTVIYPDEKFRDVFKNNIHGDGNPSSARRMLGNTIVKRYLDNVEDWESYTTTLPLRSGLTFPVKSASGDEVILGENIKIKKVSDFKTPTAFKYSVWEVVEGEYPTDIEFKVRYNKKKKGKKPEPKGGYAPSFINGGVGDWDDNFTEDGNYQGETEGRLTIGGGGRDVYLLKVGKLISDSPDTVRVGIIANILNEYKNELMRDKCARRNPLLCKAASLYNWLSMYHPGVLEIVLPITDLHPGITLMLLILDPQSPITVAMLKGTGNPNDPVHIAQGWNCAEITTNPYQEWNAYLDKASSMVKNVDTTLNSLLEFRKKMVEHTRLDYSAAADAVSVLYRDFTSSFNVYPPKTVEVFFTGAKNVDRKLWQDQMRFVASCAFSGCCDAHIVTMNEVDDHLSQAVCFRPKQTYTAACSFTVLPDRLTNQSEYYAFLKWAFSTDFMYCPVSLNNAITSSTQAPYDGLEYSNISPKSILNNYYIRAQLLKSMHSNSPPSAQLLYGMEWLNRNNNGKNVEASGGLLNRNDPIGSMQGVGYQQGSSNDFSYGQILEVGQNANPGNYGETYTNTNSVPWKEWGVPMGSTTGGEMCPGLKIED